MCELLVGCLGKIDQEAIGAAMESVTLDAVSYTHLTLPTNREV